MPQMEYLVLAEYIRQDAGVTHIMAVGIDTFTVPADRLPARVGLSALARVSFDLTDQIGAEHDGEAGLLGRLAPVAAPACNRLVGPCR